MAFLAFDIGCIECGEPSGVVGVYDTHEEAKDAASRAQKRQNEDWHGQHRFGVFDLESAKDRSTYSDGSNVV